MKKVKITTTLRPGIKDSPGTAVQKIINNSGLTVTDVRIGKVIMFEVFDTFSDADIEKIAKLISNPVMEDTVIEIL
jgi:phosphoribosylformylglycinamidine (FGAM) synthase PurS component